MNGHQCPPLPVPVSTHPLYLGESQYSPRNETLANLSARPFRFSAYFRWSVSAMSAEFNPVSQSRAELTLSPLAKRYVDESHVSGVDSSSESCPLAAAVIRSDAHRSQGCFRQPSGLASGGPRPSPVCSYQRQGRLPRATRDQSQSWSLQ
ncbi:hypothetical protein RRG08_029975 [Elysia crispata]|uniref:Uncharacterized protein n=1 Tax=Elysia crispata TaxID=231223 RepID=A0AAE0ZKW5_9GAST|nr:hypothetical protein RRG08_029975 [Elysia crispata]